MAQRVIIDTDPGIDDALAILLALRSPELEVAVITTVSGNVPVDMATRNVFTILSVLPDGPRPPVAKGASRPLRKDPVYATHVHGEDGLGNLHGFCDRAGKQRYKQPRSDLSDRDAVDEILVQIAREPTTIITLGPLTNIAAAIERDGKTMAAARGIVMMGGAVGVSGNVTPAAEFNIFVDPYAADVVFKSGIPLTVVGLDVTTRVRLHKDHIASASASCRTSHGRLIQDCTEGLLGFMGELMGEKSMCLHDPLAVGAVVDPSFVTKEAMHVAVETGGIVTEGMTVGDRRPFNTDWKEPPNAEVCVDVDAERFISFFMERLFGETSA